MAKWRAIHASITTDGKVNRMTEFAQLLYDRVNVKADDWGIITGDTFELKGETVPLSSRTFQELDDALQEMAGQDLIWRYEPDGFGPLVQVKKFDDHQPKSVVSKRTAPKRPLHPDWQPMPDDNRSAQLLENTGNVVLEQSRTDTDLEQRRQDIEQTAGGATADAADDETFSNNLIYLEQLGIGEPNRSLLAGLPHVDGDYLREWRRWKDRQVPRNRVGPGFLVRQIEAGDWP